MNERVEKVAMALSSKDPAWWADTPDEFPPPKNPGDGHTLGRNWWRDRARAAIAAMREPTGYMISRACCVPDCDGDGLAYLAAVWRAVIDAALADQK